jgi:RNA polymerase sporulation-specific sigma factor
MFRIIRYLKDHQEENIDEVARKLDVEREQVMSAYLFQKQIISLNNEAKEEELLNFIEDKKERKSSIYDALDELDEEEREIIVLRYFQNFTQTEIAQKLDKNQSKISRMESQALSKMRKILLSK